MVTDLPLEAAANTAGVALLRMREALGLPFGMAVRIDKGIPLKAGLGGSAASAVAAVVAANALLETPLDRIALLKFAMQGEAVASGSLHADNIAPSLYGGLVLTVGIDEPQISSIPVPADVRCVLVHPDLHVATREARRILRPTCALGDVVWQSANLAGFITGCFLDDLELIRASLEDVLIEPQRRVLIRGFDAVKRAARDAGALGCSISGAGPTMFAWTLSARRRARAHGDGAAPSPRRGRERRRGLRRWSRAARTCWRTDAVPEHRGGARRRRPRGRHSAARWRRTAACTCRRRCRAWIRRRWPARSASPTVAAHLLRPFFDGSGLADALPAIAREALDIPAPVGAARRGSAGRRARAVSRADGGLQGLRRTLPRRLHGAPRATARPHDTGRHVGRHRAAPWPRHSIAARASRDRAVSRGRRIAAPGAAAHLLGRQRRGAARARDASTTARRW